MHLYKYACSGHRKSAVYVGIELVDEEGRHVPDEDIKLTGNIEVVESIETADGNEITENCRTTVNNKVDGNFGTTVDCEKDVNCVSTEVMKGVTGAVASLAAFGSANPITAENYTKGSFMTYKGYAMAIIRSGYTEGNCKFSVRAEGFETATVEVSVKNFTLASCLR